MSSNTVATVAQLEALADRQLGQETILVRDSAAAISADLALRGSSSILAMLPEIAAIEVSDAGTIRLTAAQALTGGVDDDAHSALALTRGGQICITGATMAQLNHLGRLPAPPSRIEVADGAEAVLAGLDALVALQDRVRVRLTDERLEAAQLPALARLGGILLSGVRVRDSGLAIAALADSEDAASIAYLNVHGAELRGDSTVSVADLAALSRLTSWRKNGHRLIVWDSAAHLTQAGADAILAGPWVDGVFLRAAGGAVTLTAAGAVALFALKRFSAANPDGSANRVTVADSAAEIDAVRGQLAALGSDISRIVVNAGGTVTASTLRHLQSLGAILAVGVNLTVRDSAAAIAAAPAAQKGHSLDAGSWRLSRGAIVSTEDALALARRPHFSAAPYVVTLASDAVLSAAEARALASLGSGLSSGGHKMIVRDTAANLLREAEFGAWAMATTLTLTGPDRVDATAAETLLGEPKFVLTSSLTILDNAAGLLRATIRRIIEASPNAGDIHLRLAAPETLDADIAKALAALPNFEDASHFANVAPAPAPIEARPQVTLGGAAGAEVKATLSRAGQVACEQATLRAIADVSAQIAGADAAIQLAAEALSVQPSEFASLRAEGAPPREHIVAAVLAHAGVTDGPAAHAGFDTARVNVYGERGSLLSASVERQEGFVVTAPEPASGEAFSITESIDGRESAPVVVLDAATLQSAVAAAHAEFAASGAIEVRDGQYLDLYTAGSVPLHDRPALVYDPSAQTVALDIPGQAPVPLIVLGTSPPPERLDVNEILVRQAS